MRHPIVDRWKRRLLWTALAVWLILSLVVGLGSRISGSPIPGWEEIFQAVDLAAAPTTAAGELEVHFVDVGNGDCILIRQGGAAVLIDAGERGDRQRVLEYLARQGITRLDLAIATHGHGDHVGGMAGVLEALPVGRLLVTARSAAEETEAVYFELLQAAEEQAVPIETAQPGQVLAIGEAQLQVVAPLTVYAEENDRSLVTRLTFGQQAFLFTGDAGTASETDMLYSDFTLQADVIKLGHHGSDTSSSTAFLRRVAPAYAVIPCGVDNHHGLPSATVLERLERDEIRCLRSDVHGNIVFRSDGRTLRVETEREG